MERFYRPVVAAFLILIAAFAVLAKVSVTAGSSQIYISEICPHNVDLIHDSAGFFNDYIILSNSSADEIDLSGYSLSDDGDQPDKFVFRDVTIGPGEDLLVWAAPKTGFTVFGETYTDDDAVYTGFGVSDHEMICLSDSDGVVIDSAKLPSMKDNMSLLRAYAGDKGQKGTPGVLETEPPVISDRIAPPTMYKASGYYKDPFWLSIDGSADEIYYTIDGSDPYTSGILYKDTISISDRSSLPDVYANIGQFSTVYEDYTPSEPVSKATVVRAVCKNAKNGKYSGESISVYYVGGRIRDLCSHAYTLSLVADPDDLFSYENGIYVAGSTWDANKDKAYAADEDLHNAPANYNMHGRGWKREAHLTLFDPSGNCLYDEDDTVGIHGQTSRSLIQKGFNLFPKGKGEKVFEGLFPDAGDTLMLRTGSESDAYDTGIRDALNERIAGDLNVFSQSSVCCQLFINGEYWGCYNLQERLDASFIESRCAFPADNVNIIKIDPDPVALSGKENDLVQYHKIAEYVNANDLEDDGAYDRFCEMVDIDSLIDWFCAELFFANDDTYYANLAMFRSRVAGVSEYQDGKWRYLLYDLDNTDAYAPNAGADIDSFTDGSYIGFNACNDLVFSNLVKNQRFRHQFIKRFEYLLANDFSYERIAPIIDEMEETYTVPMVESVRRFSDPEFDSAKYHENIDKLRSFFKERGGYIHDYMMQYMGD